MTRAEYLKCPRLYAARGRDLPQSILTVDQVRAIRANVTGRTAQQWADEIGCHVRTVEKVLAYVTWKHVT